MPPPTAVDRIRVRVVAPESEADLVRRLAAVEGVDARSADPADGLESIAAEPADCFVVLDVEHAAAAAATARDRGVPVIVYADAPASAGEGTDGADGHVRRTADGVDRLVEELRRAVDERKRAQLREDRRRVARLHDGTARLAAARSVEGLCARTVDVAERILEFDLCYVGLVEGDEIVPRAVSETAPSDAVRTMRVSEGIAGKTIRTGESQLVETVEETPEASPTRSDYRSGISVPIGDRGVFQAVSTRPRGYDETDLELAELLVAHARETLKRIEAEAELREERDRLGALFENVPDAAAAYEFDGETAIVRRVNPAFERVFGYAAEEIVGEDMDENIVPPEHASEARTFSERLRAGEPVRAEVERLTKRGRQDFLLHVVPARRQDGCAIGYAIYTDLSEQKERERELRRQNERLDEFASIVSHDLRNPLTVADGYLALAREERDDPALRRAADALDRMGDLIEGLLTLARKGQIVGEREPVDLGTVARRAWANTATADATLSVESECALEADAERLAELLTNLFRNAVEHGGPDVRVRLGGFDGGFYVEDDGPGIDPDERDRAFETGYTTRAAGNGFGLAIVRRIAEAHGWRVRATDAAEAEGGARFEFLAEPAKGSGASRA
ncbi:ATP-binding protein [Halegenticoccus soli]|uniref:ATP-binding protein n=1 Tax=Halegenticoccus soli TaxID=1985678 RepID=UPI000C6D8067|nr:ATP-binding protein [Halegenticoccus soli]